MSWDCATDSQPKARKDYRCNACVALFSTSCMADYSGTELEILKAAEKDDWMIKKGNVYRKTQGFWDGEPVTFRARPEIDELCRKYDAYE